ncbi:MAG TPA: glycosyltransferase, partial [Planctomycetota bacterium]|nr:glycosyltransferase [Planctomycetota bacterium]
AGRPIVASAVDGVPEAVVDGRNGFLFAPGDIGKAADGVLRLLSDPALAARFGAAGRAAVEEFSETRMVAEQERIYTGLLPAGAR